MMDNFALERFVGSSDWTEQTHKRIQQAARYSYPVLIFGPAGTGKKLIARAIHAHSERSSEPLIPFRCGRLPSRLEIQQLFGHATGASPLARGAALGCLGAAQGGTLLLEDVDQLDAATQQRLLELLKSKRLIADGACDSEACNVRIIATSRVDLKDAAREGLFSFELLYYLNAITLATEPLKNRLSDLAPLVRHFMARITLEHGLSFRRLTAAAMALLETYSWPENAAELEDELEVAILSTNSDVLDLFDFPRLLDAVENDLNSEPESTPQVDVPVNAFESLPALPKVASDWASLDQVEGEHIESTLRRCGYRLRVAARMIGLELPQLQAKIRQHGLKLPINALGHTSQQADSVE